MFSAVWLSWKSFSGISFPVFGWSKHFTEIVGRSSGSSIGVDRSDVLSGSWIVRGSERWFVGRSSGSSIGVDRSDVLSGSWIGAMCVGRSSLVRGSEWIGDLDSGSERVLSGSFYELGAWIGAHRDRIGLGRSTGSLDRSALSTSMCCCAWIDPVLLCVRWFSVSLLSSLCVAVRGDVIRK